MHKRYERFQSLSLDRQQQLRQLDLDLQELPDAKLKHLIKVMQRYQAWLAQLPKAEHSK